MCTYYYLQESPYYFYISLPQIELSCPVLSRLPAVESTHSILNYAIRYHACQWAWLEEKQRTSCVLTCLLRLVLLTPKNDKHVCVFGRFNHDIYLSSWQQKKTAMHQVTHVTRLTCSSSIHSIPLHFHDSASVNFKQRIWPMIHTPQLHTYGTSYNDAEWQ